jgi:hypothetical protein
MEENLAVTKPALMGGEVQEFKNFSQYEANVKHSRTSWPYRGCFVVFVED